MDASITSSKISNGRPTCTGIVSVWVSTGIVVRSGVDGERMTHRRLFLVLRDGELNLDSATGSFEACFVILPHEEEHPLVPPSELKTEKGRTQQWHCFEFAEPYSKPSHMAMATQDLEALNLRLCPRARPIPIPIPQRHSMLRPIYLETSEYTRENARN